jgi:hypothetical protein
MGGRAGGFAVFRCSSPKKQRVGRSLPAEILDFQHHRSANNSEITAKNSQQ